jgi:hypothetical protein
MDAAAAGLPLGQCMFCPNYHVAMSKKAPKHHVEKVRRAAASPRRTGEEAASLAASLMHDPRKSVREIAASALSQRAE